MTPKTSNPAEGNIMSHENFDLIKEVRDKRQGRIFAHLPKTNDLTLLALKGHLLVEEVLEEIIHAYCLQPSHLEGVDIRFQVKAKLARALIGDILPDSMWTMVDALNSIRNDLAHKLESQKLKAKVEAFIEKRYLDNKELKRPDKTPETPEEIAHEFSITIHYLLGQLTVSETFIKAYLYLRNEMLRKQKS